MYPRDIKKRCMPSMQRPNRVGLRGQPFFTPVCDSMVFPILPLILILMLMCIGSMQNWGHGESGLNPVVVQM